jgi:tRNA (mo5U34)-methyltransferase
MDDVLSKIKKQKWFYEFNLPDGSLSECYLPSNVKKIHQTREKALRRYLASRQDQFLSALDVSCHEGYYSFILREYIDNVIGIDKNQESLKKAELISKVMTKGDVQFNHSSLEDWPDEARADFVLCYGLLYHVENIIQIIRSVSKATKKTLCIETQVLPFNISGAIEDGSYQWQREVKGIFGLCVDYSDKTEGGLTDLALVPSVSGLDFLLKQFNFTKIDYYSAEPSDYEQFVRGHRIIVFAEK